MLSDSILDFKVPAVFCATAYSRALWEAVGGYDDSYRFAPDASFLYRVLVLDPDFAWIARPLFAYRVHGGNQTAQAAASGALWQLFDSYALTHLLSDAQLQSIGVSRRALQSAFVRLTMRREVFGELYGGHWMRALRSLAFVLSAYPTLTLRWPISYVAALAVAGGPVSVAGGWVARTVRQRWRARRVPPSHRRTHAVA